MRKSEICSTFAKRKITYKTGNNNYGKESFIDDPRWMGNRK